MAPLLRAAHLVLALSLLVRAPPALAQTRCALPGTDFVLGIDASKSVERSGWSAQVAFANDLIDSLLSKGVGHRVALYWFNDPATSIAGFSSNANSLKSSLNSLSYPDVRAGSTNHPAGYIHARSMLQSSGSRGEPVRSFKYSSLTSTFLVALQQPTFMKP